MVRARTPASSMMKSLPEELMRRLRVGVWRDRPSSPVSSRSTIWPDESVVLM